MLNNDNSDYNKSLTYYYIGHFSKFIKPGAVRVAHSKYLSDLRVTAFKNPDGSLVIVMFNGVGYDIEVNVCIGNRRIKDVIEKESMVTYVVF